MKPKISLLAAMCSLLALTGCTSKAIHSADLVGKYKAELPQGAVEILEFFPNGVCHQDIRLANGVTYVTDGKWRFNEGTGTVFLEHTRHALTPGQQLAPDLGKQPPSGSSGVLPVMRTLTGRIAIAYGQSLYLDKM